MANVATEGPLVRVEPTGPRVSRNVLNLVSMILTLALTVALWWSARQIARGEMTFESFAAPGTEAPIAAEAPPAVPGTQSPSRALEEGRPRRKSQELFDEMIGRVRADDEELQ